MSSRQGQVRYHGPLCVCRDCFVEAMRRHPSGSHLAPPKDTRERPTIQGRAHLRLIKGGKA